MISERRLIEIRRGLGPVSHVEAVIFGDWAAHRFLDDRSRFTITILPLGLSLPPDWCLFDTLEQASAAAEEIARLRNSWSVVTQADFTIALRDQLQEIVKRHGARSDGPVGIAALADRTVLGRKVSQRLNGYGPALG